MCMADAERTSLDTLECLPVSADIDGPPIDWDLEKESFERDYLRDLP
jgi:hypothetical protein